MRGEVPHTLLCFPQSPAEPDQRERKMAMRPYETMIVFDTAVDAQTIQIALDRALETIRTHEGTPGAIDRWGKRPLAYEINKRKEGYYVLVEFSGDTSTVDELNRILTLSDEVLRYKILRRHERPSAKSVTAQA
jgi:small subunit ribosomal protein S6